MALQTRLRINGEVGKNSNYLRLGQSFLSVLQRGLTSFTNLDLRFSRFLLVENLCVFP
jgi:hypothetical protein